MSGKNILSLLGLALRGGRLAVGEEPVALAAKAGQARLLLVASDAAGNTLRRAEHLAREGHCLWLVLPFPKAELGGALGRGSAALAALTDLGLAAAVAERLAAMDPERYGEAAARMDLKRRRAKERQSAPHRAPPPPPPPAPQKERRPSSPRRERASAHPPKKWREAQDHPQSKAASHRFDGKGRPHGAKPGGTSLKASGRFRGEDGRQPFQREGSARPQGGKAGRPPRQKGKAAPPFGKGRGKDGGR